MNSEAIIWGLFAAFLAVALPFAILDLREKLKPGYKPWVEQLMDMKPK